MQNKHWTIYSVFITEGFEGFDAVKLFLFLFRKEIKVVDFQMVYNDIPVSYICIFN